MLMYVVLIYFLLKTGGNKEIKERKISSSTFISILYGDLS